ncbi:UNVERIFIED_CONTAM: hypothetical protein FKN15_010378 [Acipenser sinensis]
MADRESVPQGEAPDHTPPYMIFLLVLFFFLTGLLGFLICHVLKKKGYRCRTGELEEEESEGKLTREDTEGGYRTFILTTNQKRTSQKTTISNDVSPYYIMKRKHPDSLIHSNAIGLFMCPDSLIHSNAIGLFMS